MAERRRRALVTGASSGIGEALVRLLAGRGHEVWMVARRGERLRELCEELAVQHPRALLRPVVVDATADDFIPCLEAAGALEVDILVNNAGLALGRSPVALSEEGDFDAMWDVNVRSLVALTRAVLPGMLKRGGADILNVCSIAGHWTYPGGAVYCASKHAVWAFTRALREETCGRDVRVMQISPGMVETEFSVVRFKGDEGAAKKVYEGMTPLTGMDVAEQMLFMLERPRHVCMDEVVLMPTDQGSPTTVHRRSP